MADTVRSLPAFAARLVGESDVVRQDALHAEHADYTASKQNWQILIDAFEGGGGFADGNYLWRYKAELWDDFGERKNMARYHNYMEAIVDLYVRHVFTQEPKRETTSKELKDFWEDVDGDGTDITTFLRKADALALASGHAGILMDATPDEPSGPSKADQRSRPFLTRYVATAITDWRTKRDAVTGIKLIEAAPAGSIVEPTDSAIFQYLLWDEEGWARFDQDGVLIDGATPGLGLVPFTVLRPKPSVTKPFVGRSLFSQGKILQALYNRMSEEDQVLRDQSFSLLTVETYEGGDVEAAKKSLGTEFGTNRAVVVAGKIKYESPDMAVPEGVRANQLQIIREIYRIAHMRYERDSLTAESAEAIRLQYTELNEMLQGVAADLERAEMDLARFYFAWASPTPEAAQAAFDAAKVSIEYPDEFFLENLGQNLMDWAQAIAMNLGDTMTKRIKKRAVVRIDTEIPTEDLDAIFAEIDAQPSAEEQAKKLAEGAAQQLRMGAQRTLAGAKQPPQPPVDKAAQ